MSGNFAVISGEQIAAFFSETHGVVCSAYHVESVNIQHDRYEFASHGSPYQQYVYRGPAEAEIIIKGINPRHTTLEALGVERPASELSVDELMKIVYQKLDQRQ